jgi:hypothetical protein
MQLFGLTHIIHSIGVVLIEHFREMSDRLTDSLKLMVRARTSETPSQAALWQSCSPDIVRIVTTTVHQTRSAAAGSRDPITVVSQPGLNRGPSARCAWEEAEADDDVEENPR